MLHRFGAGLLVNSFEFCPRPYFPGGLLNALGRRLTEGATPDDLAGIAYGADSPGYLILFAPSPRPSVRVGASEPPSPLGVPSEYLTNFTPYTGNSTPPSLRSLDSSALKGDSGVEPRVLYALTYNDRLTRALRPVLPEQRLSPLRITAAAGTELAGASLPMVAVIIFTRRKKPFTTLGPSSLTRHGWIRVAPIVQDPPLLPPAGVWATVPQSQCC